MSAHEIPEHDEHASPGQRRTTRARGGRPLRPALGGAALRLPRGARPRRAARTRPPAARGRAAGGAADAEAEAAVDAGGASAGAGREPLDLSAAPLPPGARSEFDVPGEELAAYDVTAQAEETAAAASRPKRSEGHEASAPARPRRRRSSKRKEQRGSPTGRPETEVSRMASTQQGRPVHADGLPPDQGR